MFLQLVCHGMMVHWYRKASSPTANDHGYTILIPHGIHMGHRAHTLRFGRVAQLGVNDPGHPWLEYPSNAVKQPTRRLELQIPGFTSAPAKGKKMEDLNLSFYADRAKTEWNMGGIAFTLAIPYPNDEQEVRMSSYGPTIPPYNVNGPQPGDPTLDLTARSFRLNTLNRVVGARVFTFNVNLPIDLRLVDLDTHASSPWRVEDPQYLHLYSEPATPPGMGGNPEHIEMMNEMLNLRVGNRAYPFNLKLNPNRVGKPLPNPSTVSGSDDRHLWEILSVSASVADPAECGQGGGCFDDPPPPCTPGVDC